MADPDPHDDTSADHEQLETELLAQDRDARGVATADIDEATARSLVDDLIDADDRDREPTILTNDGSFAEFEPAPHSLPELSIEHVP